MSPICVWGFEIPATELSLPQIQYLNALPQKFPDTLWLRKEMDRVWDDYGLNNRRPLALQPIGEFYSHPVWLLNGVFSVIDPSSLSHREAIAACLSQNGAKRIADFGGGFGELALQLVHAVPDASVSIIEPYALKAAANRLREEPRIRIVPDLVEYDYDAIIAQDVLEHVEDPILLASRLASSVRDGGYVVFANCFSPLIKCHLPSTFHLRHTFKWVMSSMGLRYTGTVAGAEHALLFVRKGAVELRKARSAERLSRILGPIINGIFRLRDQAAGLLASR